MTLKVVWEGKYRYCIEDSASTLKYFFSSVKEQAENHAKVLELLHDTHQKIDNLNFQLQQEKEKNAPNNRQI